LALALGSVRVSVSEPVLEPALEPEWEPVSVWERVLR
jgi:hypothetical protein